MNESKDLIKIAKTLLAANSLDGFNKAKAARIVNNLLHANTPKGILHDTDWSHIDPIWKAMTAAGLDWTLINATYHNGKDGIPTDKTWKFIVSFTNDNGRPTELFGVVVAAFAGTVQDPTSSYDVVAYCN